MTVARTTCYLAEAQGRGSETGWVKMERGVKHALADVFCLTIACGKDTGNGHAGFGDDRRVSVKWMVADSCNGGDEEEG